MDDITLSVQRFYTANPYPEESFQLRADSFPHLLLSLIDRDPTHSEPLHILDAGCGTGAALIPLAELNPDAHIVGLDLSPRATETLRATARQRHLMRLEVYDGDLLRRETLQPLLDASPDGFDLIYASGVLHHLADPRVGLHNLAQLLAPRGLMSVMVYGLHGRQPVSRLAQALALLRPDRDEPLAAKLAFGRQLVAGLGSSPVLDAPFDDAAAVNDTEFADRYLHVHAKPMSVTTLFDLIEQAGLRFLRWLEPRIWRPQDVFGPGALATAVAALPPRQRYQVIEYLYDHPSLELLATHPECPPRPALTPEMLPEAIVDWNPQAALFQRERRCEGAAWTEQVTVRLRAGPHLELTGIHAVLALHCRQAQPAAELLAESRAVLDCTPAMAAQALLDLLQAEIVYVRSA